MKIEKNVSLADLTTMRLGGAARWVAEITSRDELLEAIDFAHKKDLPWFVLGGGSNVVASGDYNGVIILNRITGLEKISENEISATYRIGGGEVWDSVVERLCRENLSGVEAMSFIPGRAGSTPVQNVGAYGQEIADTLIELEAYDTKTGKFVILAHDDCGFSYRNSIFKNPAARHHIIISITLQLKKSQLAPPFYPTLEKYLKKNKIIDFSPLNIRRAVIDVRKSKLPSVDEIASAGSFFKNPIVSRDLANDLLAKFPDAPHWPMSENEVKFSAGWLIDCTGLKGYENYGFQLYPKNALVITNIAHSSAENLAKFKQEIIDKVREKFGITLEQEPENLAN